MAQFKPIDTIKTFKGKVWSHSDMYFANKKKTRYTGKICNPRDLSKDPYSINEEAVHTKFAQTIAAMQALTPEQKTAYREAFENQSKYSYLRGYIFAQEWAKIN